MKETMTNENEGYFGLGMSAPSDTHQVLSDEILRSFFERFGIVTGASAIAVTKKPERIPDITFCRIGTNLNKINKRKDIIMTIELVGNSKNYNASLDSIGITFKQIPSLKESFIYNYKTKIWTRITMDPNNGSLKQEEENDFTISFGIHLNSLLDTDATRHIRHIAKGIITKKIEHNIDSLKGKECDRGTLICLAPTTKADVAVFENTSAMVAGAPVMAIKITHSPTDEGFAVECAKESFKLVPSLEEYFVYNMHSDRWIRLSYDGTTITTENGKDYSRVLKKYMRPLAK